MNGNQIAIRGVLGTGAECRSIQTDDGASYSLVGVPATFNDGDRVEIYGSFVDLSFCMAARTIGVHSISKVPAASGSAQSQQGSGTAISVVDKVVVFPMPGQVYAVTAYGTMMTNGWTNPRLIQIAVPAIAASVSNTIRYKFVLDRAGTFVSNLIWPSHMVAHTTLNAANPIDGIVVEGLHNAVEWKPQTEAMGDVPFPWTQSGGEWPFPLKSMGEGKS